MPLSKEQIISLYRKRAKIYDFAANLSYLIGFRVNAYRKKAVKLLELKPGDTVVEIGCGTGLNFALLQKAIGTEGKIIGVDLTEEMLDQAKKRIEEKGWKNVELVHSDASVFQFPSGIDGVLSTFAITLVPEFDRVIQNGCKALKRGKRFVILDLKMPSNWLAKFAPLYVLVSKPFGVTEDLALRHPWESVKKYMEDVPVIEFYFGLTYIAAGIKGEHSCSRTLKVTSKCLCRHVSTKEYENN